jgi:heme exporter protein D
MLSVSLCCSFLIVPSIYSSVYFVLCLVYRCCQCLCVVPSWLSPQFTLVFILSWVLCIQCSRENRRVNQHWTTQRHRQQRIHKKQDKINIRVNRRDNQEWTTQRHRQHWIHKTQDKINTRVNWGDNQEWTTQRHWQHRYTRHRTK